MKGWRFLSYLVNPNGKLAGPGQKISRFNHPRQLMIAARRQSSLVMLVLLIALIFVYHIGFAIYLVQRLEPLPTFEFLFRVAFFCGVVWWLRAETKRSAVTQMYCHGMLVSLAWFIIMPYHLLKTRGVKGLIPVAVLLGSFLVGQILVSIIYGVFAQD